MSRSQRFERLPKQASTTSVSVGVRSTCRRSTCRCASRSSDEGDVVMEVMNGKRILPTITLNTPSPTSSREVDEAEASSDLHHLHHFHHLHHLIQAKFAAANS